MALCYDLAVKSITMTLEKIESLLSSSVERSGIERQVAATRVCSLWGEVVRERCSPALACRSDALSFSSVSGVLVVGVTSSVVASEFQYCQHILLEAVNKQLGADIVKRVQFRVVGDILRE